MRDEEELTDWPNKETESVPEFKKTSKLDKCTNRLTILIYRFKNFDMKSKVDKENVKN